MEPELKSKEMIIFELSRRKDFLISRKRIEVATEVSNEKGVKTDSVIADNAETTCLQETIEEVMVEVVTEISVIRAAEEKGPEADPRRRIEDMMVDMMIEGAMIVEAMIEEAMTEEAIEMEAEEITMMEEEEITMREDQVDLREIEMTEEIIEEGSRDKEVRIGLLEDQLKRNLVDSYLMSSRNIVNRHQ
jgi:hypothetical protein